MWIFLFLVAFACLGLTDRPATVRTHLWALAGIVGLVAGQAALFRTS